MAMEVDKMDHSYEYFHPCENTSNQILTLSPSQVLESSSPAEAEMFNQAHASSIE